MKRAILNELSVPKTEYKEIFINPDSINIKRLLDQEVLKTASFIHGAPVCNLLLSNIRTLIDKILFFSQWISIAPK